MLKNRLVGKTAVVTAGAQGIGRAVVERFSEEGAKVFASDINEQKLSELDGIPSIECQVLDAAKEEDVLSYFKRFSSIDILVHAVGFVHQGSIEECSLGDWQKSIDITLSSAYLIMKNALPKMKSRGGSIITIGSVASSIKGFPKRAAYGAAKGGVIGLSKSIAADYLSDNIRCNCVCPGTVDSPSLRERIEELSQKMGSEEDAMKFFIDRQPAGRFGTVEEIASLCTYLASDESAFINGQTINIDGGITI